MSIATDTLHRCPLTWPDYVCAEAYDLLSRWAGKWFGSLGIRDLGPEGRTELIQAIMVDVMTGGDIPAGVSITRHLFRTARLWKLRRGYDRPGYDETKRERIELDALERAAGPYAGASIDSRQPDPARMIAAAEQLSTVGARVVSVRQRRNRRRVLDRRHSRSRHHWYPVADSTIVRGGVVVATGIRWDRVTVYRVAYRGTLYRNRHAGTPAVSSRVERVERPGTTLDGIGIGPRVRAALGPHWTGPRYTGHAPVPQPIARGGERVAPTLTVREHDSQEHLTDRQRLLADCGLSHDPEVAYRAQLAWLDAMLAD